jgi:hypothetical protein
MGNCEKCSGRGYHNLKIKAEDARFPDPYIPGVSTIFRVQPCKACNGTGRADRRPIDNALVRLIFG